MVACVGDRRLKLGGEEGAKKQNKNRETRQPHHTIVGPIDK